MSRPRVLMVGLSCLDYVWGVERFPPTSSRTDARAYRVQGGGPAATAAVAAARLGAEVELVALHGEDAAGAAATEELERWGVGVAGVRTVAGARSFVSAVLVDPSGERWIFPYRGEGLVDDDRWLRGVAVEAFDAVLIDLRHPRLCAAAADKARAAGVPVVADYGNLRHWELAGLADHLLVAQECARALLGRDDPEAALAHLRQRPGQVVGVTLGADGVMVDPGDGARHLPALRVPAVDTTGAGDVFHGAYTVAVARGWSVVPSVWYASATAALACGSFGSRDGIPDDAAVRAALAEHAPEVDLPAP